MNRDDIVKWAQQWGDWNGQTVEFNDVGLERFAALVAAAERAACAKVCEVADDDEFYTGKQYADAICARKQA
jgi:hypothetical protein